MVTNTLKQNLWFFKSGDWNFYSLPGYEIHKKSIWKFHYREVKKNQ